MYSWISYTHTQYLSLALYTLAYMLLLLQYQDIVQIHLSKTQDYSTSGLTAFLET